jgi:PKD repeat protein
LLIKPEVSAPGTNVRSAVNGNGYSSFTGTSMASPHVAGAILLLKEAFPTLTGTEIKLALYFSADDLGATGEDNLYGMGIINLEAAYNYLINEGNVPAVVDTLDLVNLSLYEEGGFVVCEENFELEVAFTYQGADSLPGAKLAYSLNQASFDTLDWVGTLMPGDTVYTSILLSNLSPGDYDVKTTILDNNGALEYLFVNNSRRLEFSVSDDPHVANVVDSVCITRQSLVLAPADSPYQTLWFSNMGDPLPFHVGSSYLTPPIVSEQVYYTNAGYYGKGGMEAWDATNGGYDPSNTTAMIFDMQRTATLHSVKVYAASAGPRAIYLLDASGGNINSKFSSLQAGENEVVLDFPISAGQGYQLQYGLVPNLYKQDSGATYPYEIDDLATITGNSNQDDAYYYFYDWQFIFEGACVRSTAKATPVGGAAFAVFTLPDTIYTATVAFTDESLLAESWEWDFGDGTTSTDQSPVHTYADSGTYAISLRVRGAEGCSDVLLDTIAVIPRPLAIGDPLSPSPLTVFPNPGSGLFHARLPQAGSGKTQLQVFNQWGQQIAAPIAWEAQDLSWQIDLSAYPAGVYYLSIQQAEQAYRAVLVRN